MSVVGEPSPSGASEVHHDQDSVVQAAAHDRPLEDHTADEPSSSQPPHEEGNLQDAEEQKASGNKLFAAGQYEEALQHYQRAIALAPGQAKELSIYWCNAAACLLKMRQLKECVDACTTALEIDPTYVKAFMRRGCAWEELDELDKALQDAQSILQMDQTNSWACDTVKRLQPVVDKRNEQLKEEMIGKLKDLGNALLGKFGLSIDNFAAEKDPNTGSYSVKMQR